MLRFLPRWQRSPNQIVGRTYRGEIQADTLARNVFYCFSGPKVPYPSIHSSRSQSCRTSGGIKWLKFYKLYRDKSRLLCLSYIAVFLFVTRQCSCKTAVVDKLVRGGAEWLDRGVVLQRESGSRVNCAVLGICYLE